MRQQKRGFTLVELLVVIAIIGILVALLLPAVQAAREAARRMQCSNNVKQIGLAFQMYHDIYRQFPWAGRNMPPANPNNAGSRNFWNWTYYLLPVLEQQTVFEQTSDAVVYASPISTYHCPTRRRPQTYSNTARTDYAANCGSNNNTNNIDGVIVMSNLAQIGMNAITDGTSNTILVGEKQLHPKFLGGTNSSCCDDNEPYVNVGWDADVVRNGGNPPQPDKDHPGVQNVGSSSTIFGSRHPGGVNFVMVDGSVQHIPFTVDRTLFRNLCVRIDGNPVTVNF